MNINNKISSICLLTLSVACINLQSCSTKAISESKTKSAKSKTEVDKLNGNSIASTFDIDKIDFRDKTYVNDIYTVRLYKKGWELGDPSIQLGAGEQLELHFDEMRTEYTNYQYKVIHCNYDWTKSTLNEMEYIEGFNDNYIEYHEPSFNTNQDYIHYAVVFPNEQIKLVKSGNYLVMVYVEGNDDIPIITKRFYVTENAFGIKGNVKYPSDVEDRYYKQEVDFDLTINPSEITNPYENIKVIIEQNHRPDNISSDLIPNFVKENQLIYNYDDKNVFEAGNEYRHLDLTNTQSRTTHVYEFDHIGDTLHGYMLNDLKRQFKQYMQYEDVNGRYVTRNVNSSDAFLESEYVMLHFKMKCPRAFDDGDIYIFGEMSDYQYQERFKMTYDASLEAYTCAVYLKQGYYNYNYVFVGPNETNLETVEGTHFDTENDYLFKVYYRDPTNFYDRLMLYKIVNSRDTF
jgi:hypothetical protein